VKKRKQNIETYPACDRTDIKKGKEDLRNLLMMRNEISINNFKFYQFIDKEN
jgi:hypothetical protein